MPRLFSASVDDSLYSARLLRASEIRLTRVSHAASAIELRGSRQLKYATARPRKRKGKRSLRAASSLTLSPTSERSCNSISIAGDSISTDPSSSLQALKFDRTCNSSPDNILSDRRSPYASPPASEHSVPSTPSQQSSANEDENPSPFPLTPVPLFTTDSTRPNVVEGFQTPRGRCIGIKAELPSPSTSPDRYISNRYPPQDASKTFRVGKSPEQLSNAERLLRHRSATPDPFGPLPVKRIREAKIRASANTDPRAVSSRTRTIGTTNVQHPPQDPLAAQNRQASAGSVWNVGGGSQTSPSGPVRGISNGRGGFMSSGSNAPMFTSHFFEDDTPDQDNTQLENRLAVALDIDQTSRVLNISRSPTQGTSVSTGSIRSKRKFPYVEPQTRWMNSQWVQERSHSREVTLPLALYQSVHPAIPFTALTGC